MRPLSRYRARGKLAAVASVIAVAGGLAACQNDPSGGDDGVVRFAEFAGAPPVWILPITDPGHNGSPNTQEFSLLMWRPLYWSGTGSQPALNDDLSIADQPEYGDDNTVTITLRDYDWSDGEPVTSRDVEFWYNLIKFNPDKWSGYVQGLIPDNIAKFDIVDDKTFTLTLTDPVSPEWFTSNQLSSIVPMPQHVWDKTSDDGEIGDTDRDEQGAKDVLSFLIDKSKQLNQYDKDPLWQTVDGPWKVSQFDTEGHIEMVPNDKYTGPDKPTIDKLVQVPFENDAAEFNSLIAGDVDVGYLPFTNLDQQKRIEDSGYHQSDWYLWGINYISANYSNPDTGPIISQLYVRQALESMVNQDGIIENIFKTHGLNVNGPIPSHPENPYSTVTENPNPYNPERAVQLLTDHGWDVRPNETTTCQNPGTGANQCGDGIDQGDELTFDLIVNSGNAPVNLEMQELKSEFSKQAGVTLNLDPQPFAQVISAAFATCTDDDQSGCGWQMAVWGGGSGLAAYPTGEQLFASGGASNNGHYNDPHADELIEATFTGGPDELAAYEQYIAEQLPVIWLPDLAYHVSMIRNSIDGADQQNVYSAITPELWRITGE